MFILYSRVCCDRFFLDLCYVERVFGFCGVRRMIVIIYKRFYFENNCLDMIRSFVFRFCKVGYV